MPKRGQNIYKRKDGRWEGRYIKYYEYNHKVKYGYVYTKSYKETKAKLNEIIAKKSYSKNLFSKSIITYNSVLDSWLLSSHINVKESTYARYSHIIDRHIRPLLGSYPISEISTQLIEGFIDKKLDSGKLNNHGGLAPKTVADILTIIKSTMEYAKYKELPVICNLSRVSVKRKNKEIRILSKIEQKALTDILLKDINLLKLGVLLSLYTGIRIGELCALKWCDIDIDLSIIRINKTMQRIKCTDKLSLNKTKVIITEPKSSCSIREIPLLNSIAEYVKNFSGAPQHFFLTGCEKYIEPRTMQNYFKKYVKESGIVDANFHCLRHTFATRCVEADFEIKSLSEILGHSNVNITLNRYVHSSFDLKCSNINKLSLPI